MPFIRTFIALPAPASVQQSIVETQSKLQDAQVQVKWDTAEQFHITLKFLGDVETTTIEPLAQALQRSLEQFHQFEVTYQGVGAFPEIVHPKIVWIGIQSNPILSSMQQAVEHVCFELGFPKETRAFHPHVTLGRVKGTKNLHRLTDAIKTSTFDPLQVHCQEILLMKSDLHPDGAVYTKLKSFPLHN